MSALELHPVKGIPARPLRGAGTPPLTSSPRSYPTFLSEWQIVRIGRGVIAMIQRDTDGAQISDDHGYPGYRTIVRQDPLLRCPMPIATYKLSLYILQALNSPVQ